MFTPERVSSVFKTTEYRRFKLMETNREIDEKRVNMLVDSINEYGFITNPIIVNEKLEIIDGQGRFAALKRLGLPIMYVVHEGAGIKEVIALNVKQKNWKIEDYCRSYAKQGIRDYIVLCDVMDDIEVGPTLAAKLIDIGKLINGNITRTLTSGKFKCDEELARAVKQRKWFIQQCKDSISKLDGWRTDLAVPCLDFCYTCSKVDKKRLLNIVQTKLDMVTFANTIDSVFNGVEKIYNKGLRPASKVYFSTMYKLHKEFMEKERK